MYLCFPVVDYTAPLDWLTKHLHRQPMIDPSLTFALAVLGAILGVVNTWHALDQRRVRLKVTPAYALPANGGAKGVPPLFMIQVANLSTFPVTVAEFGFELGGRRHAPVTMFKTLEERDRLPIRLERQDAISFYFDPAPLVDLPQMQRAYARTAAGQYCTGSSPALRQLNELLGDYRRPRA